MEHVYDMIIIGGGPAGYTAALYAACAGLDAVVLERMASGGQMSLTGEIENYPGFDEGINGFELGMKMRKGAERFGAKTEQSEVKSVELNRDIKKITATNGVFFGKTVVIATGASPRKLGIAGEAELTGRGVHYCAHCDGRFYKDKTVVVVGGGNSAASEALHLSRVAKKVYLVHRRDNLTAAKLYCDRLMKSGNVEFVRSSTISEFITDGKLTGVKIKGADTDLAAALPCDGVFVSIGRIPVTDFLVDQIKLDKSGYIIAEESTRTSAAGVFAAGDVRTKSLRQIVTAVADGAYAVHSAQEYLQ